MVFTAIRTINDLSGPRKGGPFHTYFGSRSVRAIEQSARVNSGKREERNNGTKGKRKSKAGIYETKEEREGNGLRL